MEPTVWTSARVQRSKGRPSEMQAEQAMEQSGCHLSRCLTASCSPQREQPDWLACKHVVFIDIFSTSSHYLWVEVVTFCGPGLEATTAMQQRGKGGSQGREGFTKDSVYWLRRCLAGILHCSLRASLSILPPFILGPPSREQLVSIRGTLSCLPNISRTHRLAEKILTWPFMPMRAHRLTVHLILSENGELPHHVPEVARQLSLPYVTFKCLPEMPYVERSQKVFVGAAKLLCTEVFAEAIVTDSVLSEATRIISTQLAWEEAAHNLTGQFQHVQRFCSEPDPLQLTLGLLTAV